MSVLLNSIQPLKLKYTDIIININGIAINYSKWNKANTEVKY